MNYVFTVPGPPLVKRRPRHMVTTGGTVRTYSPDETVEAKEAVRVALRETIAGVQPTKDPYAVICRFYTRNRSKRDLDNLGKLVLDALNGIVWMDDSQVWQLYLRREVDRLNPRTEIEIWTMPVT